MTTLDSSNDPTELPGDEDGEPLEWSMIHLGGCTGKPIKKDGGGYRCENPKCSYAGEGNPPNRSPNYEPPPFDDDDLPF